ncbi:MAG TPA: NUDIX domain-containing protein [Nitrosarchaeum sp.]|nr:NUDIX domain-containing protein [Nitrosarchaeum sp.]
MKRGSRSYGIILVSQDKKILVCRKADTYGLLDFLRGNWYNKSSAQLLLSKTTKEEKIKLRASHLSDLCKSYCFDYGNLVKRFGGEDQKKAVDKWLNLSTNIKGDFEFPKGRMLGNGEKSIACAMREFYEETGISIEGYGVSNKTVVKEKIPCGSVVYTIKYFLIKYHLPSDKIDITKFHRKEVSRLLWVDKNNAADFLDPNKTKIVSHILDILELFDDKSSNLTALVS